MRPIGTKLSNELMKAREAKYTGLLELFGGSKIRSNDNNKREMLLTCRCGKKFWKAIGHLQDNQRKGIINVYCSRPCFDKHRMDKTKDALKSHKNTEVPFICKNIKKQVNEGVFKLNDPMPRYLRGIGAEQMVMAHCLNSGYPTFPTLAILPYDLVIDFNGRLLKIQVKSAVKPSASSKSAKYPIYRFDICSAGYKKKKQYKDTDYDIVALVALDIGVIAYFAKNSLSSYVVSLAAPYYKGTKRKLNSIDCYPLTNALKEA